MQARSNSAASRFARSFLLVAVLLTCLRVWVGPTTLTEPARAQLPDSAMQRNLLIAEVRRTNELLTEIRQDLRERTLNVRIQSADNPSE